MPEIDPAVLAAVADLQTASDDEDVKIQAAAQADQQLVAAQAADAQAQAAKDAAKQLVQQKYEAAVAALRAKYLGV